MKKLGRNEKCQCGSGKKYKHCCLIADAQKAQPESFNEMEYPEQYFGFASPRSAEQHPFDYNPDEVCCVVTMLSENIVSEIVAEYQLSEQLAVPGKWLLSGHIQEKIQFSGPFDDIEKAFEAAREKFGAIRFMSAPESI